MRIPPIWQTPYKGRITAMTFGTIFATPLYRGCRTPHPEIRSDRQGHWRKPLVYKDLRSTGPPPPVLNPYYQRTYGYFGKIRFFTRFAIDSRESVATESPAHSNLISSRFVWTFPLYLYLPFPHCCLELCKGHVFSFFWGHFVGHVFTLVSCLLCASIMQISAMGSMAD